MLPKLKNLFIFCVCLAYLPFRGKANKSDRAPRAILILRTKPNMGDSVYITPLFRAVKKTYSDSRLVVVGSFRVKEVIDQNPDIDDFLEYRGDFFCTLWKLRRTKWDFAALANAGSFDGLALLYLSGARCISAFSTQNGRPYPSFFYRFLVRRVVGKEFRTGTYVPGLYLSLLEPIGANTADEHFRLFYSAAAEKSITSLFEKNGVDPKKDFIVGISPGGSTEERWWSAERFAKLAYDLVAGYGAKIFLMGAGKDEKAISACIAHAGKGTFMVNMVDQPLDELKAFVSKAKLMIGNDSGPMVTADAFDVANLVFVGPTDEREYHRPSGATHRIVKSPTKNIRDISLESARTELRVILESLRAIDTPPRR